MGSILALCALFASARPDLAIDPATPPALALPPSLLLESAPRALRSGTMVWKTVQIRLSEAPTGPLWIQVLGLSTSGRARLWPFAEVVQIDGDRVRVRYPVGASSSGGGSGEARATLVVAAAGSRQTLGRRDVVDRVRVEPGALAEDRLDAVRAHHAAWMEVARAARASGGALVRAQPLERFTRLPSADAVPEGEASALTRLTRARVEAAAARALLRATVMNARAPGLAEGAVAALAALDLPRGPEPFGPLDETVGGAITQAERRIRGGYLLQARILLERLRSSAIADPPELARALVLQGALIAARGDPGGSIAIGQARCLVPAVSTEIPLAPLARLTAEARRADPCRGEPLGLGPVRAERVRSPDRGAGLRVLAGLLHDPNHLVARARVERLGAGGAPAASLLVDVEPGAGVDATFVGDPSALHQPKRAGLRIDLLDRFGTTVLRAGGRDPVVVELTDGEGVGGFEVPTWVWVIAGSVVVVAAGAVAVGYGATTDEVERAVGPVSVSF